MTSGGCFLATAFCGAEKAVPQYGVMGPVKAALETAVEYTAAELALRRLQLAGPIATTVAGLLAFAAFVALAVERVQDLALERLLDHQSQSQADQIALSGRRPQISVYQPPKFEFTIFLRTALPNISSNTLQWRRGRASTVLRWRQE